MPRKISISLVLAIMTLAVAVPLQACRYTVREIGYADFGANQYQLHFYYDARTPASEVKTFQQVTAAAFFDANIAIKTVNVDTISTNTGLDYFKNQELSILPTTVLVSPEGSATQFHLSNPTDAFQERVWQLVEKIVTSPLRRQLLPELAKTYGAVLLVEGADPVSNKTVKKMAKKAIGEIQRMLKHLPKTVDAPPLLITLPFDKRNSEQVLLWSLGIKTTANTPGVAVLYGRGRRMGPVLSGKHLTADNLLNLLSLIGADCECGLDRSWLLGTMMPLRWPQNLRELLVHQLGFDVENPVVKSEMSQILSISQSRENQQATDRIFSYREEVVALKKPVPTARISFAELQALQSDSAGELANSPLKIAGIIIGVFFVLILIAGSVFFIRAKRR